MATQTSPIDRSRSHWLNAVLLLLILIAFARVSWRLGADDLWWDESLTLQRAEESLLPLLRNEIVLRDGLSQVTSTDQHPFFYFVVQAVVLRLAGNDEFALRFVSAAASTLMVPVALAFSILYVRRGVFAPTAPAWAALLAAVSPFLLWFGQEARPYALWALLALLSTYTLLRASEQPNPHVSRWPWIAGYVVTVAMFVTTHYYAVFLLPVHAVLVYLALRACSRTVAAVAGFSILVAGLLMITVAFWYVVERQNVGENFRHISWKILLPDLLNAFSLGLSVDISRVFVVDLLFGLLALAAAIWALRSRSTWAANGWVPVAMVAVPVAAILVGDNFHPLYMTARHLSLIAGPFIVLVGAGLGLTWTLRPSVAILAALVLIVFTGISTDGYFTQETYAKADFSRLASDLDDRLAPGDIVLIKSPFAWRVFSYYQPKVAINGASGNGRTDYGDDLEVYGAPLLNTSWEDRFAFLDEITDGRRRIWLLVSGTQGHMDLNGRVEKWLEDNLFKVQETTYFSQSSLKSHLYLPEIPVFDSVPKSIEHPAKIVYGDRIRLHGYDAPFPPDTDLALPLTLYWEAAEPTDRRYKYQVKLVELMDDGTQRTVSLVEQEPYMGAIPTIYWDPGKIIVEYTELPPAEWPAIAGEEDSASYRFMVQIYDAESLEKLHVTASGDYAVADDGATVVLPTGRTNLGDVNFYRR